MVAPGPATRPASPCAGNATRWLAIFGTADPPHVRDKIGRPRCAECGPLEDRFGRPCKDNDKGKVEGLVGYARRNFLVPVPSFPSFDALNAHLGERCMERLGRQLRGHRETIGRRMERAWRPFYRFPRCRTTPETNT